jgi:hypothetical protein
MDFDKLLSIDPIASFLTGRAVAVNARRGLTKV